MSKIKIGSNEQVKIPANIADKYNLKKGDSLDVIDLGSGIIFISENAKKNGKLLKKLNDLIWDCMEEEADEAITKGEVYGPFQTAEDLSAYLHKLKV